MFNGPIAIVQVPAKFMMKVDDAAEFLSMDKGKLREKADLGEIPCKREGRERKFLLSALIKYAENLVDWVPNGNQ